jgi:glycosyltransferase involved in cell wall biosynthesis
VTPRVLFLSYSFPPIGGAEAQRNARLVRHLPQHGYEPVVLTGSGSPNWTPLDPSLRLDGVEAYRLTAPEPPRSGAWGRRAERWLRCPSAWGRWWHEEARRTARRAVQVDLVHASIAPYETAETAVAVARELRRPLVVDFEHPWALDEMMVYPTRAHRALELARMRRVLSAADAVIMNTPEAARRVRELVPGKRVTVVPSGVEHDDFAAGPAERGDGVFRIIHTGLLHTDLAVAHRRYGAFRRILGGSIPGVDLMTRSHVFLLEALARVEQDLRRPVELHLVGELTPEDEAALANAPVPVRRHGFLPHADTVALIRTADLLFLPLPDVRAGDRVGIVPCKTYEYLASGKPILAAVPDGDARDLLAQSGTALICRPADVAGLARALARELRRWRAQIAAPYVDPRMAAQFQYEALAGTLAAVYDDVLNRPGGTSSRATSRSGVLEGRAESYA